MTATHRNAQSRRAHPYALLNWFKFTWIIWAWGYVPHISLHRLFFSPSDFIRKKPLEWEIFHYVYSASAMYFPTGNLLTRLDHFNLILFGRSRFSWNFYASRTFHVIVLGEFPFQGHSFLYASWFRIELNTSSKFYTKWRMRSKEYTISPLIL